MLEWPYVGAEQAQTKYSAAEAITTANVGDLEIAWKWGPNEKPLDTYGTRPGPFQTTPVRVGNVLYLSTMYTRVVALDAETGRLLNFVITPRTWNTSPPAAEVVSMRSSVLTRSMSHTRRFTPVSSSSLREQPRRMPQRPSPGRASPIGLLSAR